MNDTDQELRDYYESQRLPDSIVEEILAAGRIVHPPFWRQPQFIAVAATIALLLLVGGLIYQSARPSLESIVTAEVLKNHAKQLAPEVSTSDFAEIQSALPKLGFPISPTKPELLSGLSVQGGRYCSLQKEIAAQISLLDPAGKPCTLYIAPLTEPLLAIDPGVYEQDGGVVQIWRDTHRLFALAR
ncbi:MAG: hypothetical protein AAFX93_04400 [Verrucomicrobiota bacterium]